MANHKSAEKRIRSSQKRRLRNRYKTSTLRTALKAFRKIQNKEEAAKRLPDLVSMLDRMAKTNVIHKNKAANLKSRLTRRVNSLA
jgi:small subunit ribosomal protein S20